MSLEIFGRLLLVTQLENGVYVSPAQHEEELSSQLVEWEVNSVRKEGSFLEKNEAKEI